jgi:hypothetical protein
MPADIEKTPDLAIHTPDDDQGFTQEIPHDVGPWLGDLAGMPEDIPLVCEPRVTLEFKQLAIGVERLLQRPPRTLSSRDFTKLRDLHADSPRPTDPDGPYSSSIEPAGLGN